LTSRFLDKDLFSLSKVQANRIPPLPNPCVLEETALYQYFASHSTKFSLTAPQNRKICLLSTSCKGGMIQPSPLKTNPKLL
jgi:hypothetical protein